MHYKPEPCDTRTSHLAEGMAELGHDSSVLTSFPNYPFGKIYDGYRQRLLERTTIKGVQVTRVPMFPDHSLSKVRRAFSYLSFGLSSSFLGTFFTRKPDLIWIHHPPLTTGIAGYLLSKIKRVPYVYEIHDLWPQTLVSTGMIGEGKITRLIQRMCDFLHHRAAAVIVTSEGMRQQTIRDGIEPSKIVVIPQWSQQEAQSTVKDDQIGKQFGLKGKFNILFTGNLGVAQNLDTVLDAAKSLRDLPDLQILIMGDGVESERLRSRVAEEGIENISFTGQVTQEVVQSAVPWADGLLIHLKKDPLFAMTIPSKTQSYLASGRPILCGVDGDAASIVSSSNAGICFRPDNPEEMARAIRLLYSMSVGERNQLGVNARNGYEAVCSKAILLQRYDDLFRRVVVNVQESVLEIDENVSAFNRAA